MREVKTRCPRCGRESYVATDSWSGTTQASLDAPCADGCKARLTGLYADFGPSQARPDGGGLMPALVAAVVVLAPVAGVILAQTR